MNNKSKVEMNANYKVLATHGQQQMTRNWPLNKRLPYAGNTICKSPPDIRLNISNLYMFQLLTSDICFLSSFHLTLTNK
jgi:hypothetical protein